MPTERVAMRHAREIIRLKYSSNAPTREIARRLGLAPSTVRETLKRFEDAGLVWPLPEGMSDGDLEAALYSSRRSKRGQRSRGTKRKSSRRCSLSSAGFSGGYVIEPFTALPRSTLSVVRTFGSECVVD